VRTVIVVSACVSCRLHACTRYSCQNWKTKLSEWDFVAVARESDVICVGLANYRECFLPTLLPESSPLVGTYVYMWTHE